MSTAAEREARLLAGLAASGGMLIAYSGGVDSSYLLAVAAQCLGDRAVAATAVSPSLAEAERAAAAALARDLGVRHFEVPTGEMERAAYRRNDDQRCYHCKTALLDVLEPLADELELPTIAVGTIVDDLGDHRPGQRAAAERGVATPLADAGLTKADVRELSRRRRLPTWDKPAAACLASRVVHGLAVTPLRLSRIDRAEAQVRRLLADAVGPAAAAGGNLRVRDHGEVARIEVDPVLLAALATVREPVAAALHALGWKFAAMDLDGFRSGSMNPQRTG
jgi:pyridinium-3,5-biscarboxylic acid mononucleotide sulfurtransferase